MYKQLKNKDKMTRRETIRYLQDSLEGSPFAEKYSPKNKINLKISDSSATSTDIVILQVLMLLMSLA